MPFVRNGVTVAANSNINFMESQNFAGKFTAASTFVPSNFVAATGSGGVAASLLALLGPGVSYLSPAYTNTFLAQSSAQAKTNNLSVASLRNSTTGIDVTPTYQNATMAIGAVSLPTNRADPTQWVPNASNPTVGYPISGTSQILVNQCYANHGNTPSVAASVVDFLTLHYNNNAAILRGNGFDTVPSNYVTAINDVFLVCNRAKLNIGNTTVCGSFAGR
ncbi:substrate-binding domain-containing protein [Burkholderia sp. Ac-20353]|uniref:substrate-binding domain-containing protein n=1 Tax=Burkholderia sp. Ac-20353 TaxID=2703894 RepID=UPI001F11DF56|nr:substrate-binding domain-containing protein [Burkholderia sp. Ac-20353]